MTVSWLRNRLGAVRWRGLVVLLVGLACFGWLISAYLLPSTVEAVIVKRGDVVRLYRAVGSIDADRKAVIAAPSSGRISAVLPAEGDVVRQKDVLVRLDTLDIESRVQADLMDAAGMGFALREAQASLAALQAREREAVLRLQRYSKLAERGFVTRTALIEAKVAVEVAQSDVARARAEVARVNQSMSAMRLRATAGQQQLDQLSLRAPISGVVIRQLRMNGEIATLGSSILEIADPQSLNASLRFNAAILPSIMRGSQIQISTDNDSAVIIAIIYQIGSQVDADTDEVEVKARFHRQPENWALGQRVIGRIPIVETRSALIVPRDHIVRSSNGTGVWVADAGRARWRSVVLGRVGDEVVEIRQGLQEGEVVLGASGQFSMRRVDAKTRK